MDSVDGSRREMGTRSSIHSRYDRYLLAIGTALNVRAVSTASPCSTQRASTVIFQFPVALLVACWSNEQRMLAFLMHIV
jgi:hypothetical protein